MISRRQPASPVGGRGSRVFQWILGIAAPILAGTMIWWVPAFWGQADLFDNATPLYVVTIATFLFAIVGAALLRSWWSLLIVPVAWILGEAMAALFVTLTTSSFDWTIYWQSRVTLIILAAAPLVVGAGLGALFSRWLARRPPGRPISQTPLGA